MAAPEPAPRPEPVAERRPAPLFDDLRFDAGLAAAPAPHAAPAATAVAERPAPWTEAQQAAMAVFFERLADWVRTCPEAVPEGVRAALPADLRASLGL